MPIQLPLPTVRHLNNGLFSDYYLNEIVPRQNNWLPLIDSARPIFERLRKRFSHIVNPAALDEAQIEDQWVKPVLLELGWHYSVQVKIRYGQSGHRKPDYGLTETAAQAAAITNQIYKPAELRALQLLAVADAKAWGVSLDTAPRGERNPSQQIDEYLRYSELPWGILTDGRYWRLYERDTSKNNTYYAVDLMELLATNDVEAFLYFYAFFRQEAFIKDGWLDAIRRESTDYAEKLSDTLEEQVYEALELIAQGFLDYRRNRLTATPETLRDLYEQSLVLLYRLLFIFYAESRDILPLRENANYKDSLSLNAIKNAIRTQGAAGLTADSSNYYGRLKDLFFAIDQGNPEYAMPAYNGRLFSAAEHPFLEQYTIGDKHLAPALDKLARVTDESGKLVFVDYRDLEVRHLGAIYEKLLDYQLEIATEPLTVKEGTYTPTKTGDKVEKKLGEVYLRTGNNQRKVTGSYYTPDYIVRFIVERTLEPLLTYITEQYATRDAEGHWNVAEPNKLRAAILALNILDPATGSGHFMVDATAYIAEWLRALTLAPADLGGAEDELLYWKRQVVAACIYGVDLNPLAVELAKLSLWLATLAKGKPLSFLDHHVKPGNSLIGARGAEIGLLEAPKKAKKTSKTAKPETTETQLPLLQDDDFAPAVRFAIGQMSAIETTIADRVEQVKEQEQMYAALNRELASWRRIADVWTAQHFGVKFDKALWKIITGYLRGKLSTLPPSLVKLIEQAEAIAVAQHFFHWELIFPEVFFAADGTVNPNPGFDAVVGNPPYVRQELIAPIKPALEKSYQIYQGTADLFLYFYEQGLKLLKPEARLGFITSGTYMNSNSASAFRKFINENAAFENALNFGENQPFRGAEMVYPTMAILRKGKPQKTFRSLFVEDSIGYTRMEGAVDCFDADAVDCLSEITAMDEWKFQPVELTELFKKVLANHPSLSNITQGNIFYGVKTGFNDAFFIDGKTRERLIKEHSSSAEIIKPMLRGEDLRPWYHISSGDYLIFTRQGIDIEHYPAVKAYLEQFRSKLEPKPKSWQDGSAKWAGRKAGSYRWYELQDNVAYFTEFDKPKIIWAEIAKLPRFSWDAEGKIPNNKGHIIVPASSSTLAVINSRPIWFIISQICVPLRLRAGLWQYQITKQFVERLPIPELTADQDTQLAGIAEQITVLARDRYQMHEAMRRRIGADLGKGGKLNEKLQEWWLLSGVSELRAEVKKAFKGDIPLAERDDWDKYLADRKAKHAAFTNQIIALEMRLNAIVYEAFKLTSEEIALIEQSTKYPYGEV